MTSYLVRSAMLLALLGLPACSGTPDGSTAAPTTTALPVFDGFDYQPKRVIEAGESFTFTANAHATGATVFTEWQADSGVLSVQDGTSTAWQAVKPGNQVQAGRVRIEVRVVTVGGTGVAKGGTAFLTVDDQGRANMDAFVPNVYSDSPGPTPTPGLTPPPVAAPLPSAAAPMLGASGATTP